MKKGATDPEHARLDGLAQVRSYIAATECSGTYGRGYFPLLLYRSKCFLASVRGRKPRISMLCARVSIPYISSVGWGI